MKFKLSKRAGLEEERRKRWEDWNRGGGIKMPPKDPEEESGELGIREEGEDDLEPEEELDFGEPESVPREQLIKSLVDMDREQIANLMMEVNQSRKRRVK